MLALVSAVHDLKRATSPMSAAVSCCRRSQNVWWCAVLLALGCGNMREQSRAREIRWDADAREVVPVSHGAPHVPRALGAPHAPAHPFMAAHGASSMHVDSFTTNVYPYAGPLGRAPQVSSRSMGFLGGECPTINFDRDGRIVTVCVKGRTPKLMLLDPDTLAVK